MKERPPCCIKNCDNSALIFMYNKFYCGPCVVEMDRKSNERMQKEMEDLLNDD